MNAHQVASQFNTDRTHPGRWTVTFSNPPINMFVPCTIVELGALMTDLEADPSVKVVVFQSANPDFFIAHLDVSKTAERPGVLDLWRNFVLRLSSAPVVSIAKIRGRTRGIGNEFVLACDMRFASGKVPYSATPRSASGSSRGAERWNGSRAWSAAHARLRSCSAPTISMPISPSATAG
jgi:enoyl-CoA hydratase/carnithine racemase